MPQLIIFSDIDGTLIDRATYEHHTVALLVKRVMWAGIPIVLCSSKTRAEQEPIRADLGISDPFIVENGSAILVPQGSLPISGGAWRASGDCFVRELGIDRDHILRHLADVRSETGLEFMTYSDMTVSEVARITGLSVDAAAFAKQRDYSETIVTPLTGEQEARLSAALNERGLRMVSGGRFLTVTSQDSDKGRAVRLLTAAYRRRYADVLTVGLGDSANDLPLLAAVDLPKLVRKQDLTWEPAPGLDVELVDGIGPAGWVMAVRQLLLSRNEKGPDLADRAQT